jgi:putative glycosyltransferase
MAGLAQATGDYVFILDSDLEEEPEWLGLFFQEMRRQPCDVVYGISNDPKGGWLYTLARATYYRVLNFLSPIRFPANVCTARLMSRRYVDTLLQFGERELFMAGIWHMAGFSQMAVQVAKRDGSPTTYSFGRRLNLFVNAVTAFSTRPLVMISVLGVLLSALALLFVAFVIFRKAVYGVDIEGWASVMAAVLLIGGASLFFNGVIAIYIAKIFVEVKQRPRTIVRHVYRNEARTPHDDPGPGA